MTDPRLESLAHERCVACEGGVPPLGEADLQEGLACLPGWSLVGGALEKTFTFEDYHHTMAFVNAVAWVAHRENHHPSLEVSYRRCRVRWITHAVGAVTRNDLVAAARVEALS